MELSHVFSRNCVADGEPDVVRPFLLQPHVARMVVRQLDDQHPFVLQAGAAAICSTSCSCR